MSRGPSAADRDAWLPVAAEARAQGVSERTFRRRLLALHAQLGGGVLRAHNLPGTRVRKWFFNPAKATAAVERVITLEDLQEQLGELVLRVEDCERNDIAHRQRLNSLKAKMKAPKTGDAT